MVKKNLGLTRKYRERYSKNRVQKQAIVTILILDFQTKLVRSNKEGHVILIKGTIHQEHVTIASIYEPNIDTPGLIKQTLLDIKSKGDTKTMIVCDFNR